jgi:hypothetical protein
MTHISEEQLVLYYYGESTDETGIGEHLASCEPCRSAHRSLQRVLAAIESAPVPERAADYGRQVWRRIRPRLEQRTGMKWSLFIHPPRWAIAAALGSLLVAAFLLGRFWPRAELIVNRQEVSGDFRERIFLASMVEHIDRAQRLLIELTNEQDAAQVDISADQSSARDLLASNRIYRQTATMLGEAGIAGILEDLERILLQVAHSPSSISMEDLADIRQRIHAQGIVFKLRVVGSRMLERERALARQLAQRAS